MDLNQWKTVAKAIDEQLDVVAKLCTAMPSSENALRVLNRLQSARELCSRLMADIGIDDPAAFAGLAAHDVEGLPTEAERRSKNKKDGNES